MFSLTTLWPILQQRLGDALRQTYRASTLALNMRVFPLVVKYATHPYVILATMLLLIPLILDSSNTSLALVLGNYTNVVSASVSSIVLFQSLIHHHENKKMHAQHAQDMVELHNKIDALSQQTVAHTVPPSSPTPAATMPASNGTTTLRPPPRTRKHKTATATAQ